MLFKSILICFDASQLVAGHGAIVKAVGDQGGNGTALGSEYYSRTSMHLELSPRSRC